MMASGGASEQGGACNLFDKIPHKSSFLRLYSLLHLLSDDFLSHVFLCSFIKLGIINPIKVFLKWDEIKLLLHDRMGVGYDGLLGIATV